MASRLERVRSRGPAALPRAGEYNQDRETPMIAILLAAQMISSAPPLSPAEAARILAASPGLSNWANHPEPLPPGPTVSIIESSPTAGPFGEFWQSEPRRLDGTLLSQPVDWYAPAFLPWQPFYGSFAPRLQHRGAGPRPARDAISSFRHIPVVRQAAERAARR